MTKKKKGDYDVGYGKPPKSGQFKPGESGNPKGRKKGAKNLRTVLEEELADKMQIVLNGKKLKVSKQQAFVKTLMAKAINGDVKAGALLMNTVLKVLPQSAESENEIELTETDEAILADFVQAAIASKRKDKKK